MFLVLKYKYHHWVHLDSPHGFLISRGHERFVNEIHRHNSDIVNYSSSFRAQDENFDNVGFPSSKNLPW